MERQRNKMSLSTLTKIKTTPTKRLGRGESSGKGKTSGKGNKGQKSRGRGKIRLGFEGGQLPLIKRLPFRRGVGNRLAKKTLTITLEQLAVFESGAVVDSKSLIEKGLLKKSQKPNFIRLVAKGDITKPLHIKINFTLGAKKAIEKAKGKVEEQEIVKEEVKK